MIGLSAGRCILLPSVIYYSNGGQTLRRFFSLAKRFRWRTEQVAAYGRLAGNEVADDAARLSVE